MNTPSFMAEDEPMKLALIKVAPSGVEVNNLDESFQLELVAGVP